MFFCLLTFCSLTGSSFAATLEVANEEGERIVAFEVNPKCGFAIRYTHSVALSPVTDYFTIRGGEIWLRKTEYSDFGAGLPHNPEDGQKMRFEDGKVIIENYNRKVSPFYVRVGRIANHKLLFLEGSDSDGCAVAKILPLDKLAEPGKALKFDSKP